MPCRTRGGEAIRRTGNEVYSQSISECPRDITASSGSGEELGWKVWRELLIGTKEEILGQGGAGTAAKEGKGREGSVRGREE